MTSPPAVPGRRRRHHDHQHLHRDQHRPGGLRADAVGGDIEPGGRQAGPAGRRRGRRARQLVAGSVGPLNVTLSLSPRVDDPAFRTVYLRPGPRRLRRADEALAEGGVDLLLVETIFDTLNAKAAIVAAREVAPELPLWISVTIVDLFGRTLSGQTIEAFWTASAHARPADRRGQLLARRRGDAPARPGAGPAGAYLRQQPPERRACPTPSAATTSSRTETAGPAARLRRGGPGERRRRLLRHRARAHRADRRRRGRAAAAPAAGTRPRSRFSGLETFEIGPDTGFVMIGERTNVAGSARFRRLVEAGDNRPPSTSRSSRSAAARTCSTSTWTPTCWTASRR